MWGGWSWAVGRPVTWRHGGHRACCPWAGFVGFVGPALSVLSISESTAPGAGKDGGTVCWLLVPLFLSPSRESRQAGILPGSCQHCAPLFFVRKSARVPLPKQRAILPINQDFRILGAILATAWHKPCSIYHHLSALRAGLSWEPGGGEGGAASSSAQPRSLFQGPRKHSVRISVVFVMTPNLQL